MLRFQYLILLLLIVPLALFSGCGGSQKIHTPTSSNPYDAMTVGTDSTLEIMTWNVENFAKAGVTTVDHVVDIVSGLNVDVIALQEIISESQFQNVIGRLDGWDGYQAGTAYGGQNLAYLYRNDSPLEITAIYEILTNESYNLPRSPLVLEGNIDGEPLVVINNHFKCCGDGIIDIHDDSDEETRRLRASQLLKQYVAAHFSDFRVIIVGDLNDEISDEPANNVFQDFIDDSDNWLFADMPIAQDLNALWSYPLWPSHLDHILINGHTFADFEAPESLIQVMPVHDVFEGGISDFDDQVSDHLPVVIRLMPQSNPNPYTPARFGGQGTFEAMTWNLNQFGYDSFQTSQAVLAIEVINADVVALQEIVNDDGFDELLAGLPEYQGYLGTGATADINLAFLYRDDALSNVSITPILEDQSTAFVRAPLMLQATFEGKPISVINVHLKCCGDGILDLNDPLDEEHRRYQANLLLDAYITEHLDDSRVVVLGDFNDVLDDPLENNVFQGFLIEPDLWELVDLDIATGPPGGWSFLPIPMHLDHILVSNELFGSLANADFAVEVLPLDTMTPGGPSSFQSRVSDHLPVAVRLDF